AAIRPRLDDFGSGFSTRVGREHMGAGGFDLEELKGCLADIVSEGADTIDNDNRESPVGTEELQELLEAGARLSRGCRFEEGAGDLVAVLRAEVEEGMVLIPDGPSRTVALGPFNEVPDGVHAITRLREYV